MFDWIYKNRLKSDLEIWVSKGWVSSEGAVSILQDQDIDDGRSRLPMALAGIGVVCVALALFAFIAANWGAIPKTVKLVGIATLLFLSHGAAAVFAKKSKTGLSDLATGFATLVFVGGMALVGQIFHLPTDWQGGAFLVCLGGLAAAWLTGSKTSLVIAAIAAISWQIERSGFEPPTGLEMLISLTFLVAIFAHPFLYPSRPSRWAAIAVLLVTYGRWFGEIAELLGSGDDIIVAMLLGGLGGLVCVMIQLGPVIDLYAKWSSYKSAKNHAHWLMLRSLQDIGFIILCGLIVLALVFAPELSSDVSAKGLLPLPASLPLGAAILLCMAGLLLSFKTSKSLALFAAIGLALIAVLMPVLTNNVIVLSSACLAALTALCALGTWYNNRFWMLCAYLGLTAVALWLLQVTIGSLLGQSLFFLMAGLLLLGMALWLARIFRKQKPDQSKSEADGEATA
ncbi:MAG: DUF2157 domain-containing protein [Roseibium sp.]